jgi:hypothetical protein
MMSLQGAGGRRWCVARAITAARAGDRYKSGSGRRPSGAGTSKTLSVIASMVA